MFLADINWICFSKPNQYSSLSFRSALLPWPFFQPFAIFLKKNNSDKKEPVAKSCNPFPNKTKFSMIKNFYTTTSIITVILLTLNSFVYPLLTETFLHPVFFISILLISLATLTFYFVVFQSRNKRVASFNNYFLAGTTIKMMVFLIYIAVVMLINRGIAKIFVAHFLTHYVLFTVLEVVSLLRLVKK